MGTVTLPNINQTGTNEWEDVEGNDRALRDEINGSLDSTNLAANAVTTAKITDANVTTAKLANDAVTGVKLAADVIGVYRTLWTADARLSDSITASNTKFAFVQEGTASLNESGTALTGAAFVPLFQFDDADYTIAGLTTKLRVRAQVARNATAATVTLTFGLYPVTVAGGADQLTYTLGTVVSSSTVAIADPAISTITSGASSDFAVPADGAYALGVVVSTTLAANAAASLHAQLQVKHE